MGFRAELHFIEMRTGTDLLCIADYAESRKNRETNNLGACWEIAF